MKDQNETGTNDFRQLLGERAALLRSRVPDEYVQAMVDLLVDQDGRASFDETAAWLAAHYMHLNSYPAPGSSEWQERYRGQVYHIYDVLKLTTVELRLAEEA
jgi:hypothetical protein